MAATEVDLAFAGVARQAAFVRDGEASPRELVELALARIAALDPQLNAFRVVLADQALADADRAGSVAADDRGPLHGVPVAIKDDQAVAGQALTLGSGAHLDQRQPADSEMVRRLRDAGGIVVGITRVPELTQWPFTETATGGITRNPWDVNRTPGGSSGGSGAAVAAGMVPVATASDGAGSIRIPAACCALFGLKPHRDRIPLAPGDEGWHGLAHLGVLTRSVRDSALVLDALTGEDWASEPDVQPGRLRIALSTKIPPPLLARLEPEQHVALEETAALLRDLGHEVVERDPDYSPRMSIALVTRLLSGVHDEARAMPFPERLERRTRQQAFAGGQLRRLLGWARRNEAADAARLNALFDDVDVLLTPALASLPLPVGRYEGRSGPVTFDGATRFVPWLPAWNHAGNPAAAVPAGFTPGGVPTAVQLVAAPRGEALLLRLAAQLEAARPWADRRPPVS
ncbi:MAG: amidase [Solirubrobacteraceae bacterium MAG38_C4-C5]|nr:amidase [Candidatus Siliceabacter maunaloa]